jgi:hypothetical protein
MDKSRQKPVKNQGAKHSVFLHKYQVLIPLVILAKWVELEKVELALQQLQLRRGELEKFPPH